VLILVGGKGTGKSHLATALSIAAIHLGKRVRFYNAVDLVNQLDKEKQQGKAGNLAKQLVHLDAVILDELGYLPFPESGIALLFQLISHLYEKTSLIITTNLTLPNGFRCLVMPTSKLYWLVTSSESGILCCYENTSLLSKN